VSCQADRVLACDGGACATQQLEPAIEAPTWVAVGGDYVYWDKAGASVQRARYDAGNNRAQIGTGGTIVMLALDAAHVYWNDWQSFTIYGATLDGSQQGVVVSMPTGHMYNGSLLVHDGMLYFTSNDPPAVWRTLADGSGTPQKIAAPDMPSSYTLSAGDLAIDDTYLYWADPSADANSVFNIRRVKITSIGTPGAVEVFAPGLDAPPDQLAIDATNLYWRSSWGRVIGQPKAGGAAKPYIPAGSDTPNALVVDGNHIYWASDSGAIVAVNKAGGFTQTLATLAPHPAAMAVDCGALYVAVQNDADGGQPGGIFRVGKLP
jgi:hypothetical protein